MDSPYVSMNEKQPTKTAKTHFTRNTFFFTKEGRERAKVNKVYNNYIRSTYLYTIDRFESHAAESIITCSWHNTQQDTFTALIDRIECEENVFFFLILENCVLLK